MLRLWWVHSPLHAGIKYDISMGCKDIVQPIHCLDWRKRRQPEQMMQFFVYLLLKGIYVGKRTILVDKAPAKTKTTCELPTDSNSFKSHKHWPIQEENEEGNMLQTPKTPCQASDQKATNDNKTGQCSFFFYNPRRLIWRRMGLALTLPSSLP